MRVEQPYDELKNAQTGIIPAYAGRTYCDKVGFKLL